MLLGNDAGKPISLDRIEVAGEDFSARLEVDRATKQVRSLREYKDLVFVYEVHGAAQDDGGDHLVTAVLVDLPSRTWTNWPALTGDDAGKSFSLDLIKTSTGEDLTNRLEINRSTQQVRSIAGHENIQFLYEVH
jgi:hypothetical protein